MEPYWAPLDCTVSCGQSQHPFHKLLLLYLVDHLLPPCRSTLVVRDVQHRTIHPGEPHRTTLPPRIHGFHRYAKDGEYLVRIQEQCRCDLLVSVGSRPHSSLAVMWEEDAVVSGLESTSCIFPPLSVHSLNTSASCLHSSAGSALPSGFHALEKPHVRRSLLISSTCTHVLVLSGTVSSHVVSLTLSTWYRCSSEENIISKFSCCTLLLKNWYSSG